MGRYLDLLASASLGAGLFAVVGALFGGLAGALVRKQGQAPGGPLGSAVAAALSRWRGKEYSPFVTGGIVGACDGAFFLGILGFLLGLGLAWNGQALHQELFLPPFRAVLWLAIGALLLGALASVLIWGGARAVGLLFFLMAGGILGEVLENRLYLMHGLYFGLLGGGLVGILAAVLAGPFDQGGTGPPSPEDAEDGFPS